MACHRSLICLLLSRKVITDRTGNNGLSNSSDREKRLMSALTALDVCVLINLG